MGESGEYLRWLGKKLAKLPQALKGFAVFIIECKSFIEFAVGMYGILFGIVGMLCFPFKFLGLTGTYWRIIVVVGFFLTTHGIYGMEKND